MKICAIDLETTGLPDENPDVVITEVGYVVWETEINRTAFSQSFLVNSLKENEQISEEITQLTGITTEVVREYGIPRHQMITVLNKTFAMVDCVMARNAEFDHGMLKTEYKRDGQIFPTKPWICTKSDIDYPDWVRGRSQSHVAADYGFINPFPHTAMGDVMTMIKINQLGGFDLDKVFYHAKSPMVTLQAKVEKPWIDKGVSTDKAKKAGFTFDSETKMWIKKIRESRLPEMKWEFGVEPI